MCEELYNPIESDADGRGTHILPKKHSHVLYALFCHPLPLLLAEPTET